MLVPQGDHTNPSVSIPEVSDIKLLDSIIDDGTLKKEAEIEIDGNVKLLGNLNMPYPMGLKVQPSKGPYVNLSGDLLDKIQQLILRIDSDNNLPQPDSFEHKLDVLFKNIDEIIQLVTYVDSKCQQGKNFGDLIIDLLKI